MIGYETTGGQHTAPVTAPGALPSRVYTSKYHRRGYQFAKRILDVVLSIVALFILFPVFLITAVLIAATDGFPVAFKQKRIGKGGVPFDIHKFRSMVRNAEDVLRSRPDLWEEYRITYKIQNDPRISKLGHLLRKSSLDELPQLFNVLIGNMSLVGPRPIVEAEMEKYGDQQAVYTAMKPGCAGLWQCMGRSATSYEERVELDREYYENASTWFDLQILVRTTLAILVGRGAR